MLVGDRAGDGRLDPTRHENRPLVRRFDSDPDAGDDPGQQRDRRGSLAAERFASDLKADRDLVELRLTLGATARQAATPALRSSVSAGLSPIINNMMIAGIVAIPGMTTGQLLAGADVGQAIRYQILLYLGIAATVTISVLILLAIRLRRYFTSGPPVASREL